MENKELLTQINTMVYNHFDFVHKDIFEKLCIGNGICYGHYYFYPSPLKIFNILEEEEKNEWKKEFEESDFTNFLSWLNEEKGNYLIQRCEIFYSSIKDTYFFEPRYKHLTTRIKRNLESIFELGFGILMTTGAHDMQYYDILLIAPTSRIVLPYDSPLCADAALSHWLPFYQTLGLIK